MYFQTSEGEIRAQAIISMKKHGAGKWLAKVCFSKLYKRDVMIIIVNDLRKLSQSII